MGFAPCSDFLINTWYFLSDYCKMTSQSVGTGAGYIENVASPFGEALTDEEAVWVASSQEIKISLEMQTLKVSLPDGKSGKANQSSDGSKKGKEKGKTSSCQRNASGKSASKPATLKKSKETKRMPAVSALSTPQVGQIEHC